MSGATAGLRLSAVGFCGVDASADPEALCELSTLYPWIEWGVLVRPDMPEPTPRFAPESWLEKLKTVRQRRGLQMRLAGHLCGSAAKQLLAGDTSLVHRLACDLGVQRIQVNPTAANGFPSELLVTDRAFLRDCVEGLKKGLVELPKVEFILQTNEETRPLQDGSCAL